MKHQVHVIYEVDSVERPGFGFASAEYGCAWTVNVTIDDPKCPWVRGDGLVAFFPAKPTKKQIRKFVNEAIRSALSLQKTYLENTENV